MNVSNFWLLEEGSLKVIGWFCENFEEDSKILGNKRLATLCGLLIDLLFNLIIITCKSSNDKMLMWTLFFMDEIYKF